LQARKADTDFAAVIFDMDGVIVDSEPRHERAFHAVMRELGYGETHGIRFADYLGRRDDELWLEFQARHKPPHSLDELRERKRRVVVELLRREQPLFAGLPELVEKLAARVPLALASGSERAIVEEVLELGGLRRHFRVSLSAADVTRGKPDPQIFLLAAARLGVTPEDCWVIEDSKPGVQAALAAGMRVIAITNSHPARELRAATVVVQSYAEIERLLGLA
jgi:HAD superfamily hydrolase (TIGR01509 family)